MYLKYWTELAKDLPLDEVRPWDDEVTRRRPSSRQTEWEVFSLQTGTTTLKRYGDIAATANKALFMTFAFGRRVGRGTRAV